ncbi:hypothetical protein, conserved [Trypanosoma brucei gambiense DAL972]|uniref:DUF3456 domain-containing protein n=2 Tax=Trypanosoma brucei TaxID=5691 RepID=D0A716_TRYB9|nr:hypothetical protein, conserved [Trypanosoma brucei gambiense DAL972]RHW67170.1 hypothetical protein DPX39_000052800 [Trypanosoma brucei equiperdum]CBH17467.1 hypothetical protein, conserved [Trypanosoma brucei gambiense DAL972]|eukprot:XP_011779731.1 hypothetical protein, conserved [Trypanosoma brucei gambiense DAL972]
MQRHSSHLLLLLVAVVIPVCSEDKLDFTKLRDPFDMDEINRKLQEKVADDDPVQKAMPDPMDPKFRAPLRCSACGAVIEHAVRLLRPIIERQSERAARSGGVLPADALPKEYEMVDIFENLCGEVGRLYGLEVEKDKKRPTLRFSKSFGVSRLQGSWMPSFLTSTCEGVLDVEGEEKLAAMILGVARSEAEAGRGKVISMNPDQGIVDKVREMVCTKWEESAKGCDVYGVAIDPRETDNDDGAEEAASDL